MSHTQFTFTVSQDTECPTNIVFNIIEPDGCYSSGQRQTLEQCFDALDLKIEQWNVHNPDQQFLIDTILKRQYIFLTFN